MQQKVALAAAILHEPKALLLDEPTLGLDVQAARTIEQTIHHLTAEQGKAVLLTTHQMDLAQRLCDWIFVKDQGKMVAEGPTSEVIQRFGQDRQLVEIHLGCSLDGAAFTNLQAEFPNLTMNYDPENNLLNFNEPPTQQVLLTILQRLDFMKMPILQVDRREPTLEEVFLHLTSHPERDK